MNLNEATQILKNEGYDILLENDRYGRSRLNVENIDKLAESIKRLNKLLPILSNTYREIKSEFGTTISDLHIELSPALLGLIDAQILFTTRNGRVVEIRESIESTQERHDGAIYVGNASTAPSFIGQWKTYPDLIRTIKYWS